VVAVAAAAVLVVGMRTIWLRGCERRVRVKVKRELHGDMRTGKSHVRAGCDPASGSCRRPERNVGAADAASNAPVCVKLIHNLVKKELRKRGVCVGKRISGVVHMWCG
jgi:ribosomal protein L31E